MAIESVEENITTLMISDKQMRVTYGKPALLN